MATREVVTLDETGLELEVPQAGDTYEMPRDVNITGNLTVTGTIPTHTHSYLASTDIDTLAELNAIIADATLIDTTDSRLSDARTPTSHTHVEADITDLGTYLVAADLEGTNILSTGEAGGTKVLTENGLGGAAWVAPSGGWDVQDTTNGNYGHGLNALDSITVGSGVDNIAIGENAGTAITTGDDNILIGTDAGKSLSTRTSNVMIGTRAGGGTGNFGNSNVLIGHEAGYGGNAANTSNLVGIGRNALYSVQSAGSGNVAVGINAGYYVTTGTDNLFLGSSAGGLYSTGDRSVAIGYDVDFESTTDDGQIVIGNTSAALGVPIVSGYFGAYADTDVSGKQLTITGPSARPGATVNQNGGNLVLQGGQKATGGGVSGKVQVSDVLNVAASYTVATLPTGAVGDVARITDGDAALAWGATAVNSGAGATPYLCWFNGTNWTILGK